MRLGCQLIVLVLAASTFADESTASTAPNPPLFGKASSTSPQFA